MLSRICVVQIDPRKYALLQKIMQIVRIPPGNLSQIIQYSTDLSALKYLDHQAGVDYLFEVLKQLFSYVSCNNQGKTSLTLSLYMGYAFNKNASFEIGDFVESHLCKLRVVLPSLGRNRNAVRFNSEP